MSLTTPCPDFTSRPLIYFVSENVHLLTTFTHRSHPRPQLEQPPIRPLYLSLFCFENPHIREITWSVFL